MRKAQTAVLLSVMALLCVPTASFAAIKNQTFLCGGSHHVRNGGAEMRSTAINFRNADLVNPLTIERITIRNAFGVIVHDSGPAAGVPHPLNTDFATPVDITTIPPGGVFYLRTNQIWGNNGLPASSGNNEAGQAISITVEASKEGKKDLVFIRANTRSRERLIPPSGIPTEGAERSNTGAECEKID